MHEAQVGSPMQSVNDKKATPQEQPAGHVKTKGAGAGDGAGTAGAGEGAGMEALSHHRFAINCSVLFLCTLPGGHGSGKGLLPIQNPKYGRQHAVIRSNTPDGNSVN